MNETLLLAVADYLHLDPDDAVLQTCFVAAKEYIRNKTGWSYDNNSDQEADMLLCMVVSDFYENRYYQAAEEYRPTPVCSAIITHLIHKVDEMEE